jgi:hypothetical protein
MKAMNEHHMGVKCVIIHTCYWVTRHIYCRMGIIDVHMSQVLHGVDCVMNLVYHDLPILVVILVVIFMS